VGGRERHAVEEVARANAHVEVVDRHVGLVVGQNKAARAAPDQKRGNAENPGVVEVEAEAPVDARSQGALFGRLLGLARALVHA
jgi:hypothetical protein